MSNKKRSTTSAAEARQTWHHGTRPRLRRAKRRRGVGEGTTYYSVGRALVDKEGCCVQINLGCYYMRTHFYVGKNEKGSFFRAAFWAFVSRASQAVSLRPW